MVNHKNVKNNCIGQYYSARYIQVFKDLINNRKGKVKKAKVQAKAPTIRTSLFCAGLMKLVFEHDVQDEEM